MSAVKTKTSKSHVIKQLESCMGVNPDKTLVGVSFDTSLLVSSFKARTEIAQFEKLDNGNIGLGITLLPNPNQSDVVNVLDSILTDLGWGSVTQKEPEVPSSSYWEDSIMQSSTLSDIQDAYAYLVFNEDDLKLLRQEYTVAKVKFNTYTLRLEANTLNYGKVWVELALTIKDRYSDGETIYTEIGGKTITKRDIKGILDLLKLSSKEVVGIFVRQGATVSSQYPIYSPLTASISDKDILTVTTDSAMTNIPLETSRGGSLITKPGGRIGEYILGFSVTGAQVEMHIR